MPQASIFHLILAVVCAMGLGFAWYSMGVFGKTWMKEAGLKMEDIKAGPGAGYLWTMLAALVTAFVLAKFIGFFTVAMDIELSTAVGAKVGLMAGLGFVATSFASEYIFGKKSRTLYLINAGYQVLNLVLMGAVLGALMS